MQIQKQGEFTIQTQILGEKGDIYAGSLSAQTKRAYTNDILEFFGAKNFSEIQIEQIRSVNTATAHQYREALIAKGYAVSTINRKLTSLSSFFTFCCRREVRICDYNPFSKNEGMQRLRQNKKYSNTRCLTKEEVAGIVKIASKDTDSTNENTKLMAIRNRIIILLLATTGLRREELVSLKLGMFGYTSGKVIIEFVGKGGEERMVVVTPSIKALIDNYVALRGLDFKKNKDSFLLTIHSTNSKYYGEERSMSTNAVYDVVKKLADQAGLDSSDISPHCFRHTFVTEALDMGIQADDVAKLVGHSSTETTKRYDHSRRVVNSGVSEKLDSMFNIYT